MIIRLGEIEICKNAKRAQTFAERSVGLMFSKSMKGFDGLLIRPCNSIHTFFMRYSIDVVFLAKDYTIIKVIRNLRPWRMSWIYFRSKQVLELKGGSLPEHIKKGQKLEVLCTN